MWCIWLEKIDVLLNGKVANILEVVNRIIRFPWSWFICVASGFWSCYYVFQMAFFVLIPAFYVVLLPFTCHASDFFCGGCSASVCFLYALHGYFVLNKILLGINKILLIRKNYSNVCSFFFYYVKASI